MTFSVLFEIFHEVHSIDACKNGSCLCTASESQCLRPSVRVSGRNAPHVAAAFSYYIHRSAFAGQQQAPRSLERARRILIQVPDSCGNQSARDSMKGGNAQAQCVTAMPRSTSNTCWRQLTQKPISGAQRAVATAVTGNIDHCNCISHASPVGIGNSAEQRCSRRCAVDAKECNACRCAGRHVEV